MQEAGQQGMWYEMLLLAALAMMRVAHGATCRKGVGSILPRVAGTCYFCFPTKKVST